jgi:hypothetical protein
MRTMIAWPCRNCFERLGLVACLFGRISESGIRHRQLALPAGVAGAKGAATGDARLQQALDLLKAGKLLSQ